MTIEDKVRSICRALFGAEDEADIIRLMPRLQEACEELAEELLGADRTKSDGHDKRGKGNNPRKNTDAKPRERRVI